MKTIKELIKDTSNEYHAQSNIRVSTTSNALIKKSVEIANANGVAIIPDAWAKLFAEKVISDYKLNVN